MVTDAVGGPTATPEAAAEVGPYPCSLLLVCLLHRALYVVLTLPEFLRKPACHFFA
jgi:hypothetical protein